MGRFTTVTTIRVILLAVSGLAISVQANGIYGDGTGAAAMAMGGADVGLGGGPAGSHGR